MPQDPIAQGEIAALTRRYGETTRRVEDAVKVIKPDVLHLRLEVGRDHHAPGQRGVVAGRAAG